VGGHGADLAALLCSRGAPLVEALEQHRPGAREHAEGTAAYAFAAAAELGFERGRCESAREAAMLHEIGQVYVPESALAKQPSARNPEEQAALEAHYEAGYRLARGAGMPEQACGWLLRARERYDGRGPEHLSADSIPIEARLIRAACLCQTTLASPQEAPGLSPAEGAIEGLRTRAGVEIDPAVAEALIAVVERATGSSAPDHRLGA
jgi:HD-GYP domain-containing protein (c-di-GMP phosphodiesterase class II)